MVSGAPKDMPPIPDKAAKEAVLGESLELCKSDFTAARRPC